MTAVTPDVGHVLAVDDNRVNRVMLSRLLVSLGHEVTLAENGQQALERLQGQAVDLILLDIEMPEMDGYEVLRRLKADAALRDIPVIVISGTGDIKSAVRCIEMGAEDYLPKPFDPVLLRARIGASLEKKRYLREIQEERARADSLLLKILPSPIATRLKGGAEVIADNFEAVTVLFADIVDFTRLSTEISPRRLVILLNEVFSAFDECTNKFGLEKIKTVGDEYMVVGGLPIARPDHAQAIARMALCMQERYKRLTLENGEPLRFRIGINSGPVVAGVISSTKIQYDLWGDTVNIASRMASHGLVDQIQVTESTYELLRDEFKLEKRGSITVKGRGEMTTYFLRGPLRAGSAA